MLRRLAQSRLALAAGGAMATAGTAVAYRQHTLLEDAPSPQGVQEQPLPAPTPPLRELGSFGKWQTYTSGVWEPLSPPASDEVERAYKNWPDGGSRVSTSALTLDFALWSSA